MPQQERYLVRPRILDFNHRRRNMHVLDRAGWGQYRSSFDNYREESFGPFFTDQDLEFLRAKDSPVVIDLMSSTHAVGSLFKDLQQPHKLGLAVELRDKRNRWKKHRDKRRNIHQIKGDITDGQTWGRIEEKLAGKKADLIIERANGALAHFPRDIRLYRALFSRAWRTLSKNEGIFIAHSPSSVLWKALGINTEQMLSWVSLLNENGISASFGKVNGGTNNVGYVLKLVKHPSSPTQLPALQ